MLMGRLTDGGLRYGDDGEELKVFQARDGSALKEARQAGLRIVVISGRRHPALERRLADLGITDTRLGVGDKVAAALDLQVDLGHAAMTVGDDLPDLPLAAQCLAPVAVADASPVLRRRALAVTRRAGGRGAVAEVVGWWLSANGLSAGRIVIMADSELPPRTMTHRRAKTGLKTGLL